MKNKVLLTVKDKMLSLGIKHKVFLSAAIVFLVLGIIVGRTSNSCKQLTNDGCENQTTKTCDEGQPCDEKNEQAEHDEHGHQTANVTCNEDRLSDLEEVMCEHQVHIIDCDNCRFEVGIVKIDPSIAKSLIQTGVVEDIDRKNVLKFTGQVQLDRTPCMRQRARILFILRTAS